MNGTGIAYHRTSFLALAGVIAIAGLAAVVDVHNQTDPGFLTDGNNTVTQVAYLGPAAGAGLEAGDRIVSIDNIPVEDTEGFAHQARAPIDEVWIYVVDRAGQTFNVSIRQGALSIEQSIVAYGLKLIGFLFLWYGVRPYLVAPNPATTVLAFAGLALGAAFVGAPYAPWPVLQSLTRAILDVAAALGAAALVHFLLLFPTRHTRLDAPHIFKVIYGPALIVAALRVVMDLIQPDATPMVNIARRTVEGLFVAGYFGAALAIVFRMQRRSSEEERNLNGLDTILIGAAFGLTPIVIAALARVFVPGIALPFVDLYVLPMAFVPIAFKRAAIRSAKNAEPDDFFRGAR